MHREEQCGVLLPPPPPLFIPIKFVPEQMAGHFPYLQSEKLADASLFKGKQNNVSRRQAMQGKKMTVLNFLAHRKGRQDKRIEKAFN